MIRLGTDIVYIPRIQAAIERFGKRFLSRVYTNYEQQNCGSETLSRTSINKLAGRWAAKEAVVKALGTGWRGVSYTDVEIRRHPSGMPYVVLYNNAATIVAGLGGEKGEKRDKGDKGEEENMLFTSPSSPSPSSPSPWTLPPYPSALEWQLSLSHDRDYAIATAILIADTQTTRS